jgi:predicted PurR-regulated permease PerM
VPVRTILATIGLVLATVLTLYLVVRTARVLTWMVIAAFFAVALYPLEAWVQRRLLRGRRAALATILVFLVVVLALAGIITAFVIPLVGQATRFAGPLPDLIAQARAGQGPIGRLLERTNVLGWVQNNQGRIDSFVSGLTAPAAGILRGLATGITATVTILVLAYLLVLEGPKVVDGTINVFDPATGRRIRRVAADCPRSVTGYISGNLLISVICGGLTFVVLLILGVRLPDSSRSSWGSPTGYRWWARPSAAPRPSSPASCTRRPPASSCWCSSWSTSRWRTTCCSR